MFFVPPPPPPWSPPMFSRTSSLPSLLLLSPLRTRLSVHFFLTGVLHFTQPHLWLSLSVVLLVFPLLFSPQLFSVGLISADNSSGCPVSHHCLLGWGILSLTQRSQPTCLFGQAPDPPDITCCLLWVIGNPVTEKVSGLVKRASSGLCVFAADRPALYCWTRAKTSQTREAVTIRQMSRKACCCISAQSQGRLVFIAPQGGTHSLTRSFSHSSHVFFYVIEY